MAPRTPACSFPGRFRTQALTPPNAFPQVGAPGGQGMSVGAAVTVGAVAGVVVGAGAMLLKEMTDKPEKPGEEA